MNVTLSIDEQTVARARKKAEAMGKSLNQLIRDYLQKLAGGDDPEREHRGVQASSPGKATRAAGVSIETRFMSARSFFDTNVLVYADDKAAPAKQRRAVDWWPNTGARDRRGIAAGAAGVFCHRDAEVGR